MWEGYPPPTVGTFLDFGVLKPVFWVRYKVKNSSSQCNNDCSIRGGGGGDRFCCSVIMYWTPRGRVGTFFGFWGTKTSFFFLGAL